jgi:hypothetical protein
MGETITESHMLGTMKTIAIGMLLGLVAVQNARGIAPVQDTQRPDANAGKAVGKVKAVATDAITLTTDNGSEINVQVSAASRLLRVEPGQKDLKSAAPAQLQDVQPGDRLLARGTLSADGKWLAASTIVLMKATDVSAKQEHDRQEWAQHGMGGLVSAVDVAGQSVTISVPGFGTNKTVKIVAANNVMVRRYAPDSIRFDDAKPATLGDIKAGDQLRARGERSADGMQLAAREIVFGTFRNIAGTVISSDPAKNTLTVNDLATKKPMALSISTDSQLRKLSPMVAQRIAMRLKGTAPEGAPAGTRNAAAAGTAKAGGAPPNGEGSNGRSGGAAPDFQQMLSRMPAVTMSELQKGDAVMIVSTEGSASVLPTAVTLLTGVEPILTASPNGGQAAMLLSPWNLGGGGAGDAGGGANP